MVRSSLSDDIGVAAGFAFLSFALMMGAFVLPGLREVLLVLLALVALSALFRWPSAPILVFYPILWVLGAYPVELVGGRVERIIAISGVVGVLISSIRQKSAVRLLPPTIWIGIALTLGSYLFAWALHPDVPEGVDMLISLTSRMLFMILITYHVRDERDLSIIIVLFLSSTLLSCFVTFWIGWEYGFGYIRDYHLSRIVQQNVPYILQVISRNMTQATAAGVLLLAMYPRARTRAQKLLLLVGVLFVSWMAFAAEFRREILVTIPIVLAFLYFDKRSGLSRLALPLFIVSTLLFLTLVLPTSSILQTRLEKETPAVLEQREPRMVSFASGLASFLESPLVGHGPGSYSDITVSRLPYEADLIARKPFNVFIWIAVEAGIFGFIGVCTIILGAYMEARRLRVVGSNYTDLVIRLGPLFIVLIVVWFSFGNAWDGSIPWFLMGLILAAARMTGQKSPGGERRS